MGEFMPACSACGRQGVKIDKSSDCPVCKRTNTWCSGCLATSINYGRSEPSCKCSTKNKKNKR